MLNYRPVGMYSASGQMGSLRANRWAQILARYQKACVGVSANATVSSENKSMLYVVRKPVFIYRLRQNLVFMFKVWVDKL